MLHSSIKMLWIIKNYIILSSYKKGSKKGSKKEEKGLYKKGEISKH